MSIIRHLKTLFPIPQQWSEDGKQFAIRTEEAYRDYQITKENVKTSLDSLDEAVAQRAYGRRITKSIAANANSCVINLPAGLFLLSLSLPGLSKTWFGLVYVTNAGVVTVDKLCNQTGISVTTGTNEITATFTQNSATTLHMVAIPLRSSTFPSFA